MMHDVKTLYLCHIPTSENANSMAFLHLNAVKSVAEELLAALENNPPENCDFDGSGWNTDRSQWFLGTYLPILEAATVYVQPTGMITVDLLTGEEDSNLKKVYNFILENEIKVINVTSDMLKAFML